MIHLQIANSECKITGLTDKQTRVLRNKMSYTADPQASYFSGRPARKISLLSKRGEFPTGLLYIVIDYLEITFTKYSKLDTRSVPMPQKRIFTLSLGVTPYPEQMEAAKACSSSPKGRGIVVAPTGVGKSLIISLLIEQLQVPTLIVVPSLELKRQLTESLSKAFTPQKVGSLCDKKPIAIENIDAIAVDKVLKGYDCVIIDEFHHSGAKTYRSASKKAWRDIYYRFGLTATPFRSQEHERLLLESVLSNICYEISYQDAVNNKYIVPMEAYYIELPKQKVEGYTWAQVYSELVVNNKPRNDTISNLLYRLYEARVSSLCLVKELRHGKTLADDGVFLFMHGEDNNTREYLEWFNETKVDILIGTTGVLGEGVDTKPAEYVIIAGLGKSKNALMQQFGRAFRTFPGKESCKVIIFKDPSHKWTLAHFKEQCKILREEYGVQPLKLEII